MRLAAFSLASRAAASAAPRRLTAPARPTSMVVRSKHSAEELNAVAQEKYGKPFEELDAHDKMSVGGIIGGRAR
jgi:hypothetical protein